MVPFTRLKMMFSEFTDGREKLLRDLAEGGIEWVVIEKWGAVGINEYHGYCLFHCRIWQWGVKERKMLAIHWANVLDEVRRRGYKKIHACQDSTDKRLKKFQAIFGFRDIVKVVGIQNLMMQEI